MRHSEMLTHHYTAHDDPESINRATNQSRIQAINSSNHLLVMHTNMQHNVITPRSQCAIAAQTWAARYDVSERRMIQLLQD